MQGIWNSNPRCQNWTVSKQLQVTEEIYANILVHLFFGKPPRLLKKVRILFCFLRAKISMNKMFSKKK